jgi:hypothetical protein
MDSCFHIRNFHIPLLDNPMFNCLEPVLFVFMGPYMGSMGPGPGRSTGRRVGSCTRGFSCYLCGNTLQIFICLHRVDPMKSVMNYPKLIVRFHACLRAYIHAHYWTLVRAALLCARLLTTRCFPVFWFDTTVSTEMQLSDGKYTADPHWAEHDVVCTTEHNPMLSVISFSSIHYQSTCISLFFIAVLMPTTVSDCTCMLAYMYTCSPWKVYR